MLDAFDHLHPYAVALVVAASLYGFGLLLGLCRRVASVQGLKVAREHVYCFVFAQKPTHNFPTPGSALSDPVTFLVVASSAP